MLLIFHQGRSSNTLKTLDVKLTFAIHRTLGDMVSNEPRFEQTADRKKARQHEGVFCSQLVLQRYVMTVAEKRRHLVSAGPQDTSVLLGND